MDSAVEVRNLTKKFFFQKGVTVACNCIDFRVSQGTLAGIMGPNGSGKTTLIRILAGIVYPDGGSTHINGADVVRENAKAKKLFTVVFGENRNFYLRLTGRDNLYFFSSFYGLSADEAKAKIEELTGLFQMTEFLDKIVQEYSSGMKQRLGIARALLSDAPVLLLDEPTKNLDPAATQAFLAYLKKKVVGEKKKTVLMTSHSLSEISEIADQIGILKQGEMKCFGPLDELKSRTKEKDGATLENIYNFFTGNP